MENSHKDLPDAKALNSFHLFDKITEGFALGKIVCDKEEKPCDFRLLRVNEGLERILGLKREVAVGRTARELFPYIDPAWIETYGRALLKEEKVSLKGYFAPLKRHFEVSACSPQKGHFAAVFFDRAHHEGMTESCFSSDKRHRLLVENSSDLVCEMDHDGRFQYVCPNFFTVMGYKPEELLGVRSFDLMHPENLPEVMAKFALPSATLVFRFRHKNDSWHWFEATSRKSGPSGGKAGHVVIARNITGRGESEQRLRQLSHAVEYSPSVVVITDSKGDIEYVNPKFTEITGYTFEEVIGRNSRILKSGEMSSEEYRELWKKITSGHEWRGEFHNKKKNGELYWESASISPMMDGNGRITHFVAVKEDITRRKEHEKALRESEALFRTISEASPLGIILTDENTDTIYANEAQRRISGRLPDELAGAGWRDSIHPEDREHVIREWNEVRRTGRPFRSERRYLHPDGKVVWASLTAAPILDNKTVNGYVAFVEDITERKRLDEQSLRTQRMESLGTLASGVAHDLNNILSPIMMSVELLRGDMEPDMRQEMLTTIAECAARGSEMVGQVLTFARGAQGGRSDLQLRHLIKEVGKIARETFPKSINIVSNTRGDLWAVTGNSTQLLQVLMNLCINARRHAKRGHPHDHRRKLSSR